MKQELIRAQRKLAQQKAYVEKLEEEIAYREIEWIGAQVSQQEASKVKLSSEQWLALFNQQREILNQIIHNYPVCRSEAQEVLDQILILITQLSDQ